MWPRGWREEIWSSLDRPWDVIIIGGGITGAGILRAAAHLGLRALLVEAHDFASGTSSRSSKLVHGGLRYLRQGQIKMVMDSVRERDRLRREARGLVNPLGFLMPNFAGDRPPAWVFGAAFTVADLIAGQWSHRHYDALDMRDLCPQLREAGLLGGYRYFDSQTDDARLVLRVIREAVRAGGLALNYARVENLLRTQSGLVCGIALSDLVTGQTREVPASVVINATGAWADELRAQVGHRRRLRQLRGSHLIVPARRLPLRRAISFIHPTDHRPVFALPWEGVTLFGTTDVDHRAPLEAEPVASDEEVAYLLTALQYAFPAQELSEQDVQTTLAGVRPVVDTGRADPSKESREHVLWEENGLLTVAGGKLTTFRLMALDALRAVRAHLPSAPRVEAGLPMLNPLPEDETGPELSPALRLRLWGRYGADMPAVLNCAAPGELAAIGDSPCLWAELRWAAHAEGVVHLDDLLLRRVRLGLLLPNGGLDCLDRVRAIVQPELGWDDARWDEEARHYSDLWKWCYALKR